MQQLCQLCDRYKCYYETYKKNNSKGVGNPNAEIVIVGESYGANEAIVDKPFVGASGDMLNEMIADSGLRREDLFITNSVRCWHPDNKTPSTNEIRNCRSYLLNEINNIKPKLIIAVGKIALTSLGIKEAQTVAVGKLHKSPYTTVPVFSVFHPAYIMRNRHLKDDNFRYFKQGVAGIGTKVLNGLITDNYYVIRTVCQAQKAVKFLLDKKIISFDAESSGLDYFSTKIPVYLKSTAFGYNQGRAIIFPSTEDVFPLKEDRDEVLICIKLILESAIPKVAHNAKWDIGLYKTFGIDVKNLFMDTLLAAHQLDENNPIDLDSCVMRYVPEMAGYSNVIKEKYDGKPHKAHGEDLWYYNAGDADATLRLAKLFYRQLKDQDMWWLHRKVLIPATKCFVKMEAQGVQCDRELMKLLEIKYKEEKEQLLKEIKCIPEVIQFEKDTGSCYNPGSPNHNKIMFIKIYKLPVLKESEITKQPSIGKDELAVYADKHKNILAKKVRELSMVEKLLSTYLTGFYKYLYKNDIAHTQFNLAVTVTGRTSSGGGGIKEKEDDMASFKIVNVDSAQRKAPNLQNIPKKNLALRNIIKARPGRYLLGQDFVQSELGCAAAMAKDQKMIEAYMSGKDLHTQIASDAFSVPYDTVSKEMRDAAKQVSFGIIYGISPKGLARRINKSEEETTTLINKYFNKYASLKRLMDLLKAQVDSKGWVESPFHRRRRFPNISNKSYRQAQNHPIQSLSSDLLLIGINELYNLIEDANLLEHITPILAVHDEIMAEVEVGYLEQAVKFINKAFLKELYKDKVIQEVMGQVKLGIDLKISPFEGSWGQVLPLSSYSEDTISLIDKEELYIGSDLTTHKKCGIVEIKNDRDI